VRHVQSLAAWTLRRLVCRESKLLERSPFLVRALTRRSLTRATVRFGRTAPTPTTASCAGQTSTIHKGEQHTISKIHYNQHDKLY